MEIIGFEKDEKVLAKAEKSGGRVLWVIVYEVIILILWFAVIYPLLFRWTVSQYSISYESWSDLIVSAISAKAADYAFGIAFSVMNGLFVLEAVIAVILALIRHTRRELYLTNRRIFGHTGNLLLGKREINFPLSQVTRIRIRENGITRLFRYGIVDIDTPLGGFSVDGIGDPNAFVSVWQKQKALNDTDLQSEYLKNLGQEKRQKRTGILQTADTSFLIHTKKLTYKTTWQCVCGGCNPAVLEKCAICGRSVSQSQEERHQEIAEEYQTILEEYGVSRRELTGKPVLEQRERYYISAAASMYMLLCVFGAITLLSWAIFPIQVGVILGLAFSLFIGVMVILRKLWAFRVMQVMLILGMVVNGIAFIGALPELAALAYLGLVGYMVVTFCLINAGSAALSEMVQSARRRPKEQPKWSANR